MLSLLRRGLFLCCGEAGEKEKESARTSVRGMPFPSSHRPPRAFYFFDYCYFYRDTQRSASLCGGESNR